ncbi:UdgX family uracil-DNA binding protein [Pelagibacterium luteolum]|uniref:Type-4 uracil-DNA glycosylase n=1 Tax=Pelagibacterium luteolum TaxID=440168 RepID=A0A1G7V164_9HYPH|nr:UdgX family uracil-DNA binding protein [Pelagibacterium luteolum]SDG53572.1 DNA polymerase [Pelagibacterium luteolum]
MYRVLVPTLNELKPWRDTVRPLLAAGVAPEAVIWLQEGDPEALFGDALDLPDETRPVRVPPDFIAAAERALCHADPRRFDLLYRLAYRLGDDRGLLSVASDPDIVMLTRLMKAVKRDSHKMKAFVRFRAIDDSNERFAAWFEPDHFTLERTAPFFAERFAGMEWAILTPYRSAFWDRKTLSFGPGAQKRDVPSDDALEDAWRTYFASIFNPARLKVSAMTSEMPRKYWRNLPEAGLIDGMIKTAQAREAEMIASGASQPPSRHLKQAARVVPEAGGPVDRFESLGDAAQAVQGCTRCPLYQNATQAVFGVGPSDASVMMVGEQPGDSEDIAGQPFVGPAGQVFDAALGEVGIDRAKLFITNAVKHFKFVPRGKRRIHQTPKPGEVNACRFWLDQEIALVRPKVIVAMGATAARSLLGPGATIAKMRGAPIPIEDGTIVFVTIHPSYLLRLPDREKAALERDRFVRDLAMIRDHVESAIGASVALDSTTAGP